MLVSCIDLGKRRVIWFEDATASKAEIESLVDRPVLDMTPTGRLTTRRPICSSLRDIKQTTSKKTVLNLLRGLLYLLPQYDRIGMIAHRYHLALIPRLHEPLRSRIHKASYFRGGDTRGSNDWHRTCDLLIALGTPRVPVSAVRRRLLQQGQREAAMLSDGDWQPRVWTGCTPTGEPREIVTKQYANDQWRQACELIVLAELQQCIGRRRSVLDAGIPVSCAEQRTAWVAIGNDRYHAGERSGVQDPGYLSRQQTNRGDQNPKYYIRVSSQLLSA